MSDRFWVPGGNGNWSSSTNWSTSSGGASGAAAPTSADNVYVNADSGTSPTITINAAVSCLNLDFTGAITPTLTGTVQILSIYGNLTLISTMTYIDNGQIDFRSTSTGKTITCAGIALNTLITFNGVGGVWTLQDTFSTNSNIVLTNGTLDINGKTTTCVSFVSSNSNVRTLTLGAATINCVSWVLTTTTNLTFNVNTSTINLIGAGTFAGGGLTYNNVTLTGTPITITGSNTYALLTGTPAKTINVTAGTTQTATTNFVMNGTPTNAITLQSTSAGSAFTLSKSSGNVIFRKCAIKDCTATGGASYNAIAGSTSTSGNTGVTFGGSVIVEQQIAGRKYTLNASGVLTAI